MKNDFKNINELCLEETHINIAITKIGSMLKTRKVHKNIFATVDKSPHCIQMHYIQNELKKMMNIDTIDIKNYVIVDNKLEEIKNMLDYYHISIPLNITSYKCLSLMRKQ